jgi:ATP-dependent DNA helicase HFM1/MER3
MKNLLRVKDIIPESLQDIFPFEYFNEMQSVMIPKILDSDENMIIASPTASGKTVLHEAAIVRLLLKKQPADIKCVFIAPNKALCQQRATEWMIKFSKKGLK